MTFNHNISMANIRNIVVALNQGGMLSCDDIMNRVWGLATARQQQRKVTAPRNVEFHNIEYAKQQLRGEIRRSLNDYFNVGSYDHYEIYRATAHGDAERFWVPRRQSAFYVSSPDNTSVAIACEPTLVNLLQIMRPSVRGDLSEFMGMVNTSETHALIGSRLNQIISELTQGV